MAGPNSDTPAETRPSPTEIRLVQLLRSAASGPPAGGGWQQPEADFLKCKSGPKWQRRAAAGYGHAREQHAIGRLRSGAHVTLAATPHSASRNRQTSPRAKSRRWGYHHSPADRHKSADEMALPSALQSGSTRHGARSGVRTRLRQASRPAPTFTIGPSSGNLWGSPQGTQVVLGP